VLPDVIAKANKNFLVYCLVGVLKMLQGQAKCRHIDGLGSIMNSCGASILDEVLDDIVMLSACIVKRWWSSYGLPYGRHRGILRPIRVLPEIMAMALPMTRPRVTLSLPNSVVMWCDDGFNAYDVIGNSAYLNFEQYA
jgi:hypothetical protein